MPIQRAGRQAGRQGGGGRVKSLYLDYKLTNTTTRRPQCKVKIKAQK
jgi:hypothetical protein